jgi:hypothetical protein
MNSAAPKPRRCEQAADAGTEQRGDAPGGGHQRQHALAQMRREQFADQAHRQGKHDAAAQSLHHACDQQQHHRRGEGTGGRSRGEHQRRDGIADAAAQHLARRIAGRRADDGGDHVQHGGPGVVFGPTQIAHHARHHGRDDEDVERVQPDADIEHDGVERESVLERIDPARAFGGGLAWRCRLISQSELPV